MTELIKIDNSMSSNAIYFHTRQRLTTPQIEGLNYIDGVIRFETYDYSISIQIGATFGFVEVAAPALLIIANALGVAVSDLVVAPNHDYLRNNDQCLMDQALTAAKQLDRDDKTKVKKAEIERIDVDVANWRRYIKQWLTLRRQLVRELKKLEEANV